MRNLNRTLAVLIALSVFVAGSAHAEKVLRHSLRNEPPQLNSMKSTDTESGFVLGHIMEGLTRYTAKNDGSVEPGVAQRWTIDDKSATFYLRKDAKWSDGKPVTAHDFVFGWTTTLLPETASEYAFFLYPIKNAEAVNQGKKKPAELGVKAVDDYTLKIEFEQPTGYFVETTAFPTLSPVREDYYNSKKGKYGANAEDLICNGPFVLTKWVHGASLSMVKNPHYWDKKHVKIDRIEVPYITPDNSAKYNFFKDKKLDVLLPLDKEDVAKAQKDGFKIGSYSNGSLWYMQFNLRKERPTSNKNLRKAIQYVFTDRNQYVAKVIGIPGTKHAYSLIPSYMKGHKTTLLREHPVKYPKANLAEAKKYIEAAKKDFGGKLPSLVWLTDDRAWKQREAQYFQSVFKQNLGLDLKIDTQIFKQRLAKMRAGDFDIVSAGWGPDYADPMTFADLMTSWNANNHGKYANAEYDRLIREAQATSDNKKRMAAMGRANQILIDDVGIVPTFEEMYAWLKNDKATGVIGRIFGPYVDFNRADLK